MSMESPLVESPLLESPLIESLWRYPVKSMQGEVVDRLELGATGARDDRLWGLIDTTTGKLMSAKRYSILLEASAAMAGTSVVITLPSGQRITAGDANASRDLSTWLGRSVELRRADASTPVAYQMTLDPPNDEADYYDIPTPAGSFVDLAPVHLITLATLDGVGRRRPDLDWDVWRFRPTMVIRADGPAFLEDTWVGQKLTLGTATVAVRQATVRCAMPLRAQPSLDQRPALARQPMLYQALEDLHANHLGVYVDVVAPGVATVGDPVGISF